jgi:hypothetical protein
VVEQQRVAGRVTETHKTKKELQDHEKEEIRAEAYNSSLFSAMVQRQMQIAYAQQEETVGMGAPLTLAEQLSYVRLIQQAAQQQQHAAAAAAAGMGSDVLLAAQHSSSSSCFTRRYLMSLVWVHTHSWGSMQQRLLLQQLLPLVLAAQCCWRHSCNSSTSSSSSSSCWLQCCSNHLSQLLWMLQMPTQGCLLQGY